VSEGFRFTGFASPNYTQVPDEVFDVLLSELTGAEFKVLMYIIRRTFGFKKTFDNISLKQMVEGIKTNDGRTLDQGTGLSRPGVTKAVKGLEEKLIIVAQRNRSTERGDEPTTYHLHFAAPSAGPVETEFTRGGIQSYDPRRNGVDPQETVIRETGGTTHRFDDSTDSMGPGLRRGVVKDTMDMSSAPAGTDPPESRPRSLAELRAWEERIAAQERHLRRLKGGTDRG
jgi:hypothetical protein